MPVLEKLPLSSLRPIGITKAPSLSSLRPMNVIPAARESRTGIGFTVSDLRTPVDKLGEKYWWARGASELVEKPVMGTLQLPAVYAKEVILETAGPRLKSLLGPTATLLPFVGGLAVSSAAEEKERTEKLKKGIFLQRFLANTILPKINHAIDTLDPEKSGFITPEVTQARQARRIAAYRDKGYLRALGNDLVEYGADLGALLTQLWLLRKIPAISRSIESGKYVGGKFPKGISFATIGKMLKGEGAYATVAGQLTPGMVEAYQVSAGLKHAALFGAYGLFTTPGTMEERQKRAMWNFAYSVTPVVTGYLLKVLPQPLQAMVPARVVDTSLNSLLSMPTYKALLEEAGGPNKEFIASALPTLMSDIAFAWKTAGFPEHTKARYIRERWIKSGAMAAGVKPTEAEVRKHIETIQDVILRSTFKAKEMAKQARIVAPKEVPIEVPAAFAASREATKLGITGGEHRVLKARVTSAMPELKLKGGTSGAKVKWEDFPPDFRVEILKQFGEAQKAGEADPKKYANMFQSLYDRRHDTLYWMGGDADDPGVGTKYFWMNTTELLDASQVTEQLRKEKLRLDSINIISGSGKNNKNVIANTLRTIQLHLKNEVVPEEVKPTVLDKAAQAGEVIADKTVAAVDKVVERLEGREKVSLKEMLKPKVEEKEIVPYDKYKDGKVHMGAFTQDFILELEYKNGIVTHVRGFWAGEDYRNAKESTLPLWGDKYERTRPKIVSGKVVEGASVVREGIIPMVGAPVKDVIESLRETYYQNPLAYISPEGKLTLTSARDQGLEEPELKKSYGILEVKGAPERIGVEAAPAFPKNVLPRSERQVVWTDGALHTALQRSQNEIDVPVVAVKGLIQDNQCNVNFGAGITKDRNKIIVNPDYIKRIWRAYSTGKVDWGEGIVPLPSGLSEVEFHRLVLEHERIHLTTGLDGSKIDENMVNYIALSNLGRNDLAKLIEIQIPKESRVSTAASIDYKPDEVSSGTYYYDMDGKKVVDKRILIEGKPLICPQEQNTQNDINLTSIEAKAKGVESLVLKTPDSGTTMEPIVMRDKALQIISDFIAEHPEVSGFDYKDLPIELSKSLYARLQKAGVTRKALITPPKLTFTNADLYFSNKAGDAMFSKEIRNRATAAMIQRELANMKKAVAENERWTSVWITEGGKKKQVPKRITKKIPEAERVEALEWIKNNEQALKERIKETPDLDPFLAEQRRKIKLAESRNRHGDDFKDFVNDVLEDAFPGKVIDKKDAPNERLQDLAFKLKLVLSAKKFFNYMGYGEGFDKFVYNLYGKENIEKWVKEVEVAGIGAPEDTVQKITGATWQSRREDAWIAFKKQEVVSSIVESTFSWIDSESLFRNKSKTEKQDLARGWLDFITPAFQEIVINQNAQLGEFAASEIGAGGAWKIDFKKKDPNQQYKMHADHFIDALRRTKGQSEIDARGGEVKIKQDLAKGRPTLMYFNELPDYFKNIVIFSKRDIEAVVLKELLDKGVLDDTDMLKNYLHGYVRKYWEYGPIEKKLPRGVTRINELRAADYPKADTDTYVEFYYESKAEGLEVESNFAVVMGDYVSNGLTLAKRQALLDTMATFPGGNEAYPNVPLVVHVGRTYPDIGRLDHDKIVNTLKYVEVPSAFGLAKRTRGGFEPPYVHKSVAGLIESIYSSNHWEALRGVLALNRAVKWMVMPFQRLFAIQAGTGPMTHIGAKKAWEYGIKPMLPGIMEWRGAMEGKKILKGEGLYGIADQPGVDPIKLEAMYKNGVRGLDVKYTLDLLRDSAVAEKHPMLRSQYENIVEFLKTRGGTDAYAFNNYMARLNYELADALTKKISEKYGLDYDKAMKLSAVLTNDLSGMLDVNIYGKERDILQGLFFARDFTVSWIRQVTGALGIHTDWKSTGPFRFLNPLLHADISKAELKMIQPFLAKQLVQLTLYRLAFVALAQLALGQGLPWDNEKGKKLMIKTPLREANGAAVYLDPLMFRETPQTIDLFPPVGIFKNLSRGPFRLFADKLSYAITQATSQLKNKDWSGRPITSDSAAIPFYKRAQDRVNYALQQALPEFAKTGVKPIIGRRWITGVGQWMGMPARRGRPLQPGWTWEQDQWMQDITDRHAYDEEKIAKILRTAPSMWDPKVIKLLKEGKITPQRYKAWLMRERMPQTQKFKQNRSALLEYMRKK